MNSDWSGRQTRSRMNVLSKKEKKKKEKTTKKQKKQKKEKKKEKEMIDPIAGNTQSVRQQTRTCH